MSSPYKDSVGKAEDECQFLWMSECDVFDVEVVGYPQAIEVFGRDFGSHRHCGYVPEAPIVGAAKNACGAENRKRV